ncbi:hypothetical protein LR48_Vigan04g130400 [Vigna angularis]|uniref:Putative plant transposon protein domain-containing protein n=1 Tax=Phaseolus angularis TaxID=3914 RepID=A0A0L9UEH2_PHAAN|nr:hypothetical protein LR48_Vigan04g130400 [Vigna angularis]
MWRGYCVYLDDASKGTGMMAIFLYCALKGLNINIGQVIANEIRTCATSVNNKAPLGHQSLITHLCELAGVNTSTPPMERPRKEIDDSYYSQYCMTDEATQQVSPPRPPRALHRGQVVTTKMIIGLYDTPHSRQWMMDEFNTIMEWPEDQVHASVARAAEASAMEDDDYEDGDEEEADDDDEEDSD